MKNFGLRLRLRNGEAQGGGASINAGKNPLKRRLRYAVLSKIAILFLLLLVGVGNAWGAATAIPNNTIIYVDVANFNDVSHTVNNATDDKYYVSKPNYYNVTENRYTTASYTGGAGSYWPAGDSTWVQLTKISGNLFAFKTSNKWFDGKLSFWTKNQNNYGNVYEACVALLQEYDGAKNLFTLTKTKTYHSDRHASCFGTSKSAINLMKGGETLYLKANSNWKADGARFAAVFLGQSGQQWVSFTQVGSTDYYKCTIPTTGSGEWPYVIICRMNGANQTNSWDNRWNQTEDFAAPSGTENCIALPSTITTGCSWHKYTEGYAIVGEMNDWKPMANTMSGASTTKSVTMTLAAKKSYAFKVAEGFDDGWWGYDSSTDYKLTFAGQNTEYALLQTTGHDILMFTTATSGEYTFTWNTSTHKLSITYPTVTHPCSDYIYFYNDQSWNPVAIHAWNGTHQTVWGSNPALSSFVFDKQTYYYAAVGDQKKAIFGQGIDDSHKTGDLTVSDGWNKFYKKSTTAGWYPFTATLKLDHQAATNTPAPNSITVTYNNSTNLTGDVITTSPTKTGYTFGGYYTEIGGAGAQLIGTDENIKSNVDGHTGSSKKWIKGPAICSDTCYAKWTQSVPLDKENGASNGSVTLTYNSASHAAITNPTKTNYTFAGWYSGDDGTGQLIIDTDGTLQANKTDGVAFTGAGGIWIHEGSSPTLHAKWTETPRTITASATTGGSVGSTNYTAYVVTTCAISATADVGYYFTGWTTTSGSVTYADASSASTTITATSDAVITANFAPVWTVACDMDSWSTSAHQITEITASAGEMVSGYVDITLAANTDYKFKLVNLQTNKWWGSETSNNEINYVNRATAKGLVADGSNNQKIRTATAGTYRFTWDVSEGEVTVTYPHTAYKISINHGYWPASNTIGANTNPASVPGGTITSAVGSVTGALQVDGAHGTQYVKTGETVTFTHSTAASGWAWYGWGSSFNNGTHTITAYTNGSGGVTINDGVRTMAIANITADKTVYSFFKENVTTVTVNTANSNYGDLTVGGAATAWGSSIALGTSTYKDIRAAGKNGYMFTTWAIGGSTVKVSGNLTDQQIRIKGNGTASSSGTATASFAPGYVIRGSLYDDSGDGGLAGWGNTTAILTPNLSTGVGTYTATLNRSTRYKFKVYFMEGSGYWRGTSETSDISSGTSYTLPDGGNDITFTAGANGTYTFTYNFSTKALTVTFPTAYSVTYHGNGSTSGSVPTDATPYASGETVNVQGNTGSLAKDNYTLSGWNTTEHITGTTYGSAGGATFTITANTDLYAKWTQTISLDRNSGTTGSTTATATYNCSTLTGYSAPTRTGYTFGGYYTGSGGTGTLVINTAGALQSGVTDYTDAGGNWISSTARTLYAKWYQNFSIAWKVGNGDYSTGSPSTTGNERDGIATMPTNPADNTLSCASSFRGWSETNIGGPSTTTPPADLFMTAADAPTIDRNRTFYAVFANPAATSSTTITSTFTSKAWADANSLWTSGKDGSMKTEQGVQVSTTTTGANASTKLEYKAVTQVVVTYSTNANTGAGSIEIKVGGTAITGSAEVTTSGGTTGRTITYTPASALDGKVKITVNCTQNSIYIASVAITHSGSYEGYRTICPSLTLTGPSSDLVFITSTAEKTVRSQEAFTISGDALTSSTTVSGNFGSAALNGKFAFKTASGATVSTDATGHLDETTVYIYYTPAAGDTDDGLDKATAVQATVSGAGAASSSDLIGTKSVIGRHLPANFVIAAKNTSTNKWYALPANMSTGSTPAPVEIAVDDLNNPTIAYTASSNIYGLAGPTNNNISGGNGQYVRLTMSPLTDGTGGAGPAPLFAAGSSANIGKNGVASATSDLSAGWWWALTQTNTSITNPQDAKYTVKSLGGHNSYPLKAWWNATGGAKWGQYSAGESELRLIPASSTVFTEAYFVEWGQHGGVIEVDAANAGGTGQAATSVVAHLGEATSSAITLVETKTSVNNGATKYNYTVNFGDGIDFAAAASNGALLMLDWKNGETVRAKTSIAVPKIIASDITINKTNYPKKSDWNTEVHVLPGKTVTITADYDNPDVTINELNIYPGATVNITTGTLKVKTLVLRNGWTRVGEKAFDVARLYITPSTASLAKNANDDVWYTDWYIDYDQYYPIAVPWTVTTSGMKYLNTKQTASAGVKMRYYDGAERADMSTTVPNWKEYSVDGNAYPATLTPGVGYAMTAKRPTGKAFSIVRMPMTFTNDWGTNGEQGEVGGTYKNKVTVIGYGVGNDNVPWYAKGWNFIANPYMATFNTNDEGVYNHIAYQDGSDVRYVTIPDGEFKNYDQLNVTEATIKPASGFFIQAKDAGEQTITFAKGKIVPPSIPALLAKAEETMPEQDAYIRLSYEGGKDQMGLIIADEFTADYEVNADLAKILGEGNFVKTYMRYADMDMAYVAINGTLAKEWIPVTVNIPEDGEYTFSLTNSSVVGELDGVYLIDYGNGSKVTNLIERDYVFTAEEGTLTDRFSINATVSDHKTPTGIEAVGGEIDGDKPIKFIYQDKMYIRYQGVIYDATGKRINK